MKRWTIINKEIRKHLDDEAFLDTIKPFRVEIQNIMTGDGEKKTNLNIAYREIRARLLESVRVNIALLDAAAAEEEKIEKITALVKK